MKVWTKIDRYQPDLEHPLILALGNFDGLHQGHQRILEGVLESAKRRKGIAAVLTFYEHPQRVLHGSQEPALLTSPQHRLFLLREAGIEVCFLLHFTLELSRVAPDVFVREWLLGRLGVKEIHLGYNAHFGFGRQGDGVLMHKLSKEYGFDFCEAEPVVVQETFVSSSLIRKTIQEGDLERARLFLGRPFSLFASVVKGKGRGKKLGFPTANLRPHNEILPPKGVYPVEVRIHSFHLRPIEEEEEYRYEVESPGEWRPGILNYGVRPTFDDSEGELVPEVFLFDFEGDLYGKTVEVLFHPRLRGEKRFQSAEALVRTIEEDVNRAEAYFRKTNSFTKERG